MPCPEKKIKTYMVIFLKKLVNTFWDERFRIGMFYTVECTFATQGLVW